MENKIVSIGSIFLLFLVCTLYSGCEQAAKVEAEPTFSPHYLAGEKAAKDYIAKRLPDYRLAINLYHIELSGRKDFLEGFVAAFAEVEKKEEGVKYSKILEGAVSGSEFETARDLGAKHAKREMTNSQIQNLIHGSMGVSRSTALGWKAGYIEGFKRQKVTEAKDKGKSIDRQLEEEFYKEAAATYNALRAAIGQ